VRGLSKRLAIPGEALVRRLLLCPFLHDTRIILRYVSKMTHFRINDELPDLALRVPLRARTLLAPQGLYAVGAL